MDLFLFLLSFSLLSCFLFLQFSQLMAHFGGFVSQI